MADHPYAEPSDGTEADDGAGNVTNTATQPDHGAAQPQAAASTPVQPLPDISATTEIAATQALLKAKKRRTDQAFVPSQDEHGRPIKLRVDFTSITGKAYDKLIDAHAAKPSHQAKGWSYNPETFPSALLEACVTSPKMSYEAWLDLSTDEDWAGGEFGGLFNTAMRICQGGLDVPFTGLG